MPFIYALCDPDTQEARYVGKANNLRRRYEAHKWIKAAPNSYRKSWIQSLQKQGKQPMLQVLEEVSPEEWRERERWWIAEMRRQGARLTNLTDGGDGVEGLQHTIETRQKMSEKAKNRTFSPTTLAKLSAAGKAYAATEEGRQRNALLHTGRKRSPETRVRQSAVRIGMKFSPEHVANMSKSRKGKPAHNKGKPMSDKQRLAVSQAQRALTDEQVNQIIQMLADGNMSQAAIARKFNVSPALITWIKQGHRYKDAR